MNREINNYTKSFTVALVICFIFAGRLIYQSHYWVNKTARLQVKLEEQTNKNKDMRKTLIKLKSIIAGFKDKDDLLNRDIELYINKEFRYVPKLTAKTIASNIVYLSKKENISPELVVAIIEIESSFNPMAVGPKTKYGQARGLMQLMPEWAKKFDLEASYDFHNIDVNIASGIRVFKIHLDEGGGNISKGLYLYVNKNSAYVDKVYTAMGKFVSFRSTIEANLYRNQNKKEKDGTNK